MNIRQEVEKTIKSFADGMGMPVAFEGVPFTKPSDKSWLAVQFLEPSVVNPTVDAERVRKRGIVQVDVYVKDGKGSKSLDDITDALVSLFPFHEKERYVTFSVEQTPNVSSPMIDGIFRWAAVRIKYRQEFSLAQ